ncbi:hypothetical protein EIP91_007416 [Steccherinum ochraceum]|uniref:Uncharacterized protein n=1 Tax=Steccherinum ochraceum TaxID=92696 RepID=A0A4R0RP75_9APHY|nr:hypothetical protein EIP91_007416 [Steccherinum ochraceum]
MKVFIQFASEFSGSPVASSSSRQDAVRPKQTPQYSPSVKMNVDLARRLLKKLGKHSEPRKVEKMLGHLAEVVSSLRKYTGKGDVLQALLLSISNYISRTLPLYTQASELLSLRDDLQRHEEDHADSLEEIKSLQQLVEKSRQQSNEVRERVKRRDHTILALRVEIEDINEQVSSTSRALQAYKAKDKEQRDRLMELEKKLIASKSEVNRLTEELGRYDSSGATSEEEGDVEVVSDDITSATALDESSDVEIISAPIPNRSQVRRGGATRTSNVTQMARRRKPVEVVVNPRPAKRRRV